MKKFIVVEDYERRTLSLLDRWRRVISHQRRHYARRTLAVADTIDYIIEHDYSGRADSSMPPSFISAHTRRTRLMFLVVLGDDVDADQLRQELTTAGEVDIYGWTALDYACYFGFVGITRLLVTEAAETFNVDGGGVARAARLLRRAAAKSRRGNKKPISLDYVRLIHTLDLLERKEVEIAADDDECDEAAIEAKEAALMPIIHSYLLMYTLSSLPSEECQTYFVLLDDRWLLRGERRTTAAAHEFMAVEALRVDRMRIVDVNDDAEDDDDGNSFFYLHLLDDIDRSFLLRAPSEELKRRWLAALTRGKRRGQRRQRLRLVDNDNPDSDESPPHVNLAAQSALDAVRRSAAESIASPPSIIFYRHRLTGAVQFLLANEHLDTALSCMRQLHHLLHIARCADDVREQLDTQYVEAVEAMRATTEFDQHWFDEWEGAYRAQTALGFKTTHKGKSGWLSKRGWWNTSYQRRYFVRQDLRLFYFNESPSPTARVEPNGVIELYDAHINVNKHEQRSLLIETPARTWDLLAESGEDRDQWLQDLSSACARTLTTTTATTMTTTSTAVKKKKYPSPLVMRKANSSANLQQHYHTRIRSNSSSTSSLPSSSSSSLIAAPLRHTTLAGTIISSNHLGDYSNNNNDEDIDEEDNITDDNRDNLVDDNDGDDDKIEEEEVEEDLSASPFSSAISLPLINKDPPQVNESSSLIAAIRFICQCLMELERDDETRDDVCFYIPQLLNLLVRRRRQMAATANTSSDYSLCIDELERFVVNMCAVSQSIHFPLLTYFFLSSNRPLKTMTAAVATTTTTTTTTTKAASNDTIKTNNTNNNNINNDSSSIVTTVELDQKTYAKCSELMLRCESAFISLKCEGDTDTTFKRRAAKLRRSTVAETASAVDAIAGIKGQRERRRSIRVVYNEKGEERIEEEHEDEDDDDDDDEGDDNVANVDIDGYHKLANSTTSNSSSTATTTTSLMQWIDAERRRRSSYFARELRLVKEMTSIADRLMKIQPHSARVQELCEQLDRLNASDLLAGVPRPDGRFEYCYLPFCGTNTRVVRFPTGVDGQVIVFKTHERAPYLCYAEYLDLNIHHRHHNNHQHHLSVHHHTHEHDDSAHESDESNTTISLELKSHSSNSNITSTSNLNNNDDNDSDDADAALERLAKQLTSTRIEHHYLEEAKRHDGSRAAQAIQSSSPFSSLPSWRLISVIVKTGDDLAQEQFAMQLLTQLQCIWAAAAEDGRLPSNCNLRPYRILATSYGSGLIETVANAQSVHAIKQEAAGAAAYPLRRYFVDVLSRGSAFSPAFVRAQDNFIASLAAYSIACYLLQIKDRHNGNVLLDDQGRLIHIDFGFLLTNSPGNMRFETAPFKLTAEYIDVCDGADSPRWNYFCALCVKAFLIAREHWRDLVILVDMMDGASFPCFFGTGDSATNLAATVASAKETVTDSTTSISSTTNNSSYSASSLPIVTNNDYDSSESLHDGGSSKASSVATTSAVGFGADVTATPTRVKRTHAIDDDAATTAAVATTLSTNTQPDIESEFSHASLAVRQLIDRFQLQLTQRECVGYVLELIEQSVESYRTGFYDRFQYMQNGINYK